MTKQRAIRKFCLACSGESVKDVALCTDPKCVLWPWRLGYGPKSLQSRRAMESIRDRYPQDVADLLEKYDLEVKTFYPWNGPRPSPKGKIRTKSSGVARG
jgi:hypothetical protein